jgi:hypothetical protein
MFTVEEKFKASANAGAFCVSASAGSWVETAAGYVKAL